MAYFLKKEKKNSKTYLYKKKNNQKSKNTEKKYTRNYVRTIAITELKKGTGSTHLAKALCTYLNSTDIISSEEDEEYLLEQEEDTRIYDLGDYYSLELWKEKEFRKADIRLVIVTYNMEQISDLMEFVQEFQDSCVYLFNFVPDEAKKDVYDMMEDYKAYCLPLFLTDKLNKKIIKIFKEIIK